MLPVTLRIGGNPSEILLRGGAPGLVGMMQINARVPDGFVPTGILPVVLTVGHASSQSGRDDRGEVISQRPVAGNSLA